MVLALLAGAACGFTETTNTLVLATTTSTQDSGLIDLLTGRFEEDHRELKVKAVAVGSGEALELGRNKDADVLLVHSPRQEEEFMKDGYALSRQPVMHNEFILVGPARDPALAHAPTMQDALARIAKRQQRFLSRGDDSGTHRKEMELWTDAGITPSGNWYVETGQGQAETLVIASQMNAYALTDSSTFAVTRGIDNLVPVRLTRLRNPYSVIVVEDGRNLGAAISFAAWLTGEEGQRIIAEQGLFTPQGP